MFRFSAPISALRVLKIIKSDLFKYLKNILRHLQKNLNQRKNIDKHQSYYSFTDHSYKPDIENYLKVYLNENFNLVLETRAISHIKALLILIKSYRKQICKKPILYPFFGAPRAEKGPKMILSLFLDSIRIINQKTQQYL